MADITYAVITCPECGHKQKLAIPKEGKQHYFKCSNEHCNADIATKKDECCIFCSYSDTPCSDHDRQEKTSLQSLI